MSEGLLTVEIDHDETFFSRIAEEMDKMASPVDEKEPQPLLSYEFLDAQARIMTKQWQDILNEASRLHHEKTSVEMEELSKVMREYTGPIKEPFSPYIVSAEGEVHIPIGEVVELRENIDRIKIIKEAYDQKKFAKMNGSKEQMHLELYPEYYMMSGIEKDLIVRADILDQMYYSPPSIVYPVSNGRISQEAPYFHQQEVRSTVHRMAVAKLLEYLQPKNSLDFGSGMVLPYCDLLNCRYHVDFKGRRGKCLSSLRGKQCQANCQPTVTASDYDDVVMINSLQNNSLIEQRAILARFKYHRMIVVWPTRISSDEVDCYHALSQDSVIARYGLIGDFVDLPGEVANSMYVFVSDPYPVLSENFLDASKTCTPTRGEPAVSVAAHLIAIQDGKMIGCPFQSTGRKFYDFIAGGKIQQGESVYDGLMREISEELDYDCKPIWLGYATPHHARALVHFYYVVMPKGEILPKTRENRPKLEPIAYNAIVRDNCIIAISYLMRARLIAADYGMSLENAWLRTNRVVKRSPQKSVDIHKVTVGKQVIRNFMKDKNVIGVQRYCNTYHYVTHVPLEAGQVVSLKKPFFSGAPFVFYQGRVHAHFTPASLYMARVDEVYPHNFELPEEISYYGGIYNEGDYRYYDDRLGLQLFMKLHGVEDERIARLQLETIGWREQFFLGAPLVLDHAIDGHLLNRDFGPTYY